MAHLIRFVNLKTWTGRQLNMSKGLSSSLRKESMMMMLVDGGGSWGGEEVGGQGY